MCIVFVDFDVGLWFGFGIGIVFDVWVLFEDEYVFVELGGYVFGNC